MKKGRLITKSRAINQLQFQISPLFITFSQKETNRYYIYFEKGAQVLAKIDELIESSSPFYKFLSVNSLQFRITNDKNLIYQWSLYRFTPQQQEEFVETASLNLQSFLQSYCQQLETLANDLNRIYYQKQKKTELEEIWKDLRKDFTKDQLKMESIFPKSNFKLTFQTSIKCEYDFMYQRWEQIKQKRKLQKMMAKRNQSISSKNSVFKQSPSSSSFIEGKQKNCQYQQLLTPKRLQKRNLKNPEEEKLLIKFTDLSEKSQSVCNDRTTEDMFQFQMKNSALSDIPEESYESSSYFNLTKLGEKLKFADVIQEEQERIFFPHGKTQTSNFDQSYSDDNKIKRNVTLVHKASQQYVFEQIESNTKKTGLHFSKSDPKNQFEPNFNSHAKQNQNFESHQFQNWHSKVNFSSFMEDQNQQFIEDFEEARKYTIKNAFRILIIMTLLVALFLHTFNLFDGKDQKVQTKKKSLKNKFNQNSAKSLKTSLNKTFKQKY